MAQLIGKKCFLLTNNEGMLADSIPFLFVKISDSWAILDNKIICYDPYKRKLVHKFAILAVVRNGNDAGGDTVDFFEVFDPNYHRFRFDLHC